MAYNTELADKIREYLVAVGGIEIEEKRIFRGLTFMVNKKMCVCVSGENMMCRFDPLLQEVLAEKKGFQPMLMRGRELKGYCYISPDGVATKKNFEFWVNTCLDFNDRAKSSKKKTKSR